MLQLRWQDERGFGGCFIASKFPLVIGRSASADLTIEAPGVWDSHGIIRHDSASKFAISAAGEAVLFVNAERVTEKILKPGDHLRLGGCQVVVALAPARSKHLRVREAAFWTLFFLSLLLEVFLAARTA
ncbi:MAG TPA: FHA domain-containing protein [Verrucomicrobiae bacterium]|jgi:pSer/pThr/pTyr-binding forkhead associated (FHA) protein|nr:FHA domain-containing protein [Verrucomicrobiae bacterium]